MTARLHAAELSMESLEMVVCADGNARRTAGFAMVVSQACGLSDVLNDSTGAATDMCTCSVMVL